mgnify:CR=1 FL=1
MMLCLNIAAVVFLLSGELDADAWLLFAKDYEFLTDLA